MCLASTTPVINGYICLQITQQVCYTCHCLSTVINNVAIMSIKILCDLMTKKHNSFVMACACKYRMMHAQWYRGHA